MLMNDIEKITLHFSFMLIETQRKQLIMQMTFNYRYNKIFSFSSLLEKVFQKIYHLIVAKKNMNDYSPKHRNSYYKNAIIEKSSRNCSAEQKLHCKNIPLSSQQYELSKKCRVSLSTQ